jgi:diguanylate cyclase (GGDEF)-like protein
MGGEDISEKTSMITGDTYSGKLKEAKDSPPALVVLMGPSGYVGKQWPLSRPETIIGRAVESQIYIDDKSVSRNHARIHNVNGVITLLDLGSSNKTVINGQTLTPLTPYTLSDNDQIKAGNVIFKFFEKGNLEALTHQSLNEKVQKDAMTGAYSKGALLERGPEAIKRSEVLNEDLSILVLDLDHFKKINDGYGHAGGDAVLIELGRIVSQKVVRSQDYFARYGGEEFVIILAGSNLAKAVEVGERLRSTIEQSDFMFEGKKIPVTISVGAAQRKESESDWPSLFERADAALYQSKQNGRNKVTPSE